MAANIKFNPNADTATLPKRVDLQAIPGAPVGAAWFWGADDEHGRLNLLTPERIQKATQENVKTGVVIPLSLPWDVPGPALFKREDFKHNMIKLGPGIYDETFEFNPQSSSQWDGFRHFADPATGQFYNGLTSEEIDQIDQHGKLLSSKGGTQAWAETGIVGRGVLLDYYSWKRPSYDPFTAHPITASELLSCATAQGVTFRTGDIVLVRTGWVKEYLSKTAAEKQSLADIKGSMDHCYVGLEPSNEMLDFLYDNYFAAAVADSICFEVWPPKSFETSLHKAMLPLWGMPIGELWDMEALSKKCKKEKRWTFLLSSAPSNVSGAVGSPANALAIF